MPELLPKIEPANQTTEPQPSKTPPLNEGDIASISELRKLQLESLRAYIGKKTSFIIEEKIAQEKELMLNILNIHTLRKDQHARYTHILDPQFFEQRLL